MHTKLGDVLVHMGLLTEEQRAQVVERQAGGGRPFGALAEEMFGVSPRAIERAWASQYAELVGRVRIGDERMDLGVRDLIERRQAWQFQIIPMRFEASDLLIVTSECALPRAMRFVGWAIGLPTSFVLATETDLDDGLHATYPLPGGAEMVRRLREAA